MFEGLLARRYIRTQKRHSVLTVCSIAIALALMAMLFTSFSTLISCLRSVTEDRMPYHIAIPDLTKEQGIALAKFVGDDGSCKVRQVGQNSFTALIRFENYIDDRDVYIDKLLQSAKLSTQTTYYDLNTELMLLDMIDLKSRYTMVQYFALFYVLVIFIAAALRLVIDTAFEVSSKERERQFGVLQSIGATPSQIVRIITCEGLLLCVIGIPVGLAAGVGLAFAAYKAVLGSGLVEAYFTADKAKELLHFRVSPLMLLFAAITGLVWVMLSAYGTGVRIIRKSPMQAISARSNTVKKVRKHSLFGLLFGWKGKLAARNNKRQPKRFLITIISLTVSITLYAAFSVVMDKIEAFTREMFAIEQVTDFEIILEGDFFDPTSYRSQLQEIRDSGYFSDINFDIGSFLLYKSGEEDSRTFLINYYSEESYARLFDGKPPMSYETLSAQDGYLLLTAPELSQTPEEFRGMASIPVQAFKNTNYTEDEYNALPPEQKELAESFVDNNVQTGERKVLYYYIHEKYDLDVPICGEADIDTLYLWDVQDGDERNYNYVFLAGTLEQYDRNAVALYGNNGNHLHSVYANLADESQYNEVSMYLETNFTEYYDIYGYHRQLLAMYAAVRVGVTFINLMIALIAIVNMVNILSTGILNRRSEIAAMQCIGMTQRQLYGMTVVECLQYALGAGVTSLLLCEGVVFATEWFLRITELIEEMDSMISYTEPLPKVLIAAVLAFVAALAASLLPLHGMQKIPLTEQLRSVD